MNYPPKLQALRDAAVRDDTAQAWDALHMACCCHVYAKDGSEYESVSFLSRMAVTRMRHLLIREAMRDPGAEAREAFQKTTEPE